jgi:endonuclease/exonuclease/phosphatase family metal-dependent hydrolase
MRLITWNVQWGRGMDGRVDPARVVAHARAMADFDVICLQEVADNFPDLDGNDASDQFAAYAALLPGFTAIEGIGLDVADAAGRRKRFGNMILTRYRVPQVLRYTLPWEAAATRNMPRVLIEATALTPLGPLRLMTTHLEYSSPLLRAAQVEGIREAHRTATARHATPREPGPGTYVATPTTRSAILTGDFNMKPEDASKQRISAPFDADVPPLLDVWTAKRPGEPHPPSFCIYDQTYGVPHACDFVFATPDLAARVTRVFYDVETRVSDHQPVLVEFAAD